MFFELIFKVVLVIVILNVTTLHTFYPPQSLLVTQGSERHMQARQFSYFVFDTFKKVDDFDWERLKLALGEKCHF